MSCFGDVTLKLSPTPARAASLHQLMSGISTYVFFFFGKAHLVQRVLLFISYKKPPIISTELWAKSHIYLVLNTLGSNQVYVIQNLNYLHIMLRQV